MTTRMARAVGKWVAASAFALLAGLVAPALDGAYAGDAPWLPKPARGQGDKCVADTDWMRRNHMTALLQQRDLTVHDGIRTMRFSLKGCIACHAVKGADEQPVTAESPKHFCRTCHDYAAVRVDCFECHASRPEAGAGAAALPARAATPEAETLARYVRSLKP
ncbi:MAG: sulfur reduction protein DsrJ [Proteobacteria bacterium]|nr:sulfur reduction protein DsrJ [Pseudomonadota bacterium]